MKAIVLKEYGAPDRLQLEEVPDPVAQKDEVLVHVSAAGLNPIDWKLRSGVMAAHMPLSFPWVPGFDFSGTVKAVGGGVTGFAPGDRVFGRTQRCYAELVTIPANLLVKVPDGLEMTKAAALGVVSNTGHQLIAEQFGVRPGQTILLTGALGAVGRVAQFTANEAGIRVIAGVRKEQIAEAKRLGAVEAIDIADDEALAGVGLVDAVCDTLGGSVAPRLLAHVKQGGVFATVVAPPEEAKLHPTIQVHAFGAHPDAYSMQHVAEGILAGKVDVPVGMVLPLADAAKAHEAGEKGGHGKIVLAV